MKLLLVEDEPGVVDRLRARLSTLEPSIAIVIARSRSSAVEKLEQHEFDFIICDLRLPPQDGGLDIFEEHGLAVHAEIRNCTPGTPCLFFTGFGTSGNVVERLSTGGTQNIFGTDERYPMTHLLPKDEFLSCVERVRHFNAELALLELIDIKLSDGGSGLDHIDNRALQLVARSHHGTSVEGSTLGGLSGAQTLKLRVADDRGRTLANYFMKIDVRAKIEAERQNYRSYVSPLLKMGTYPALNRELEAGIGKREALCYQLAEDYSQSLFTLLAQDEAAAMAIVERLQALFEPWTKFCEPTPHSIHDLRAQRISDSRLLKYQATLGAIEKFESTEQEITTSYQHGDLHGSNVLCNGSEGAVVIDFANVGSAPACIDPIILELSVLFHSDSPFRRHTWPTNDQAGAWFNIEEYLTGCPVPGFIKRCREWASQAGNPSDLAPVVYVEALRQLKYEDTNHQLALGIAKAAMTEKM